MNTPTDYQSLAAQYAAERDKWRSCAEKMKDSLEEIICLIPDVPTYCYDNAHEALAEYTRCVESSPPLNSNLRS